MDAMTKLNSTVDQVRGDVASLTGESKSMRETVVSLVDRMRGGSGFRSIVPAAFADEVAPPTVAKPRPLPQDDAQPRLWLRVSEGLARLRAAITGGSTP
jgi:hypothetical protein